MSKTTEDLVKEARVESPLDSRAFLTQGELWLRSNGIITDLTHELFIKGLYGNVNRLVDFEYTLDPESKRIDLTLKFGFWGNFKGNRIHAEDMAHRLVALSFPEYKLNLTMERYKK